MAFAAAQKVSIRRYLGYPLGYYQYSTPLESMMDKVGGSAEEQAAVETILAELVSLETVIATASATTQVTGSLAKADEVEWFPITSESRVASVGAVKRAEMLIERLRQCFGVPLNGRYFGTSAPRDNETILG